jgi:hypothetical protein
MKRLPDLSLQGGQIRKIEELDPASTLQTLEAIVFPRRALKEGSN